MTAVSNDKETKNKTIEEIIIIEKNKLLRYIKERNDYIKSLA